MAGYSAVEIANEFLKRRGKNTWPSQMLIQKLVYIANGWNLAINNEPLVSENPQAWDNGPVYLSLWRAVKDYGYKGQNCEIVDNPFAEEPEFASLSPSEISVINHVWARYGKKSALKLSEMTHEPGTPWTNAYVHRGRNAELKSEEIRSHYIALALSGREKQAVQ